jgi:hypothetical protein
MNKEVNGFGQSPIKKMIKRLFEVRLITSNFLGVIKKSYSKH